MHFKAPLANGLRCSKLEQLHAHPVLFHATDQHSLHQFMSKAMRQHVRYQVTNQTELAIGHCGEPLIRPWPVGLEPVS